MKVVLTFSGGMDSTVLLWWLRAQGFEVKCLSVDYGQRHRRELEAAKIITTLAGVEHKIADLSGLRDLFAGSSQTSDIAVPHGHYAADTMRATVVPNRNMVLMALAGAWAISMKADKIAYAAHAGDHTIYPDCREEFVKPLSEALWNADWHHVGMIAPFINKTKSEIAKIGHDLWAPIAQTYSCYQGEPLHCGKCGTCTERKEAIHQAGFKDPTIYQE